MENYLAENEHTIQPIDIITPQELQNNSTDENKGNTEQKQN